MWGDMWTSWQTSDLFLVTSNAQVTNGKLVMSAGSAKQALDRWPNIDSSFGGYLLGKSQTRTAVVPDYHLVVSSEWPRKKLGLLQTKRLFWESSDIELVRKSLQALHLWMNHHPGKIVNIPFPGIGYGRLRRGDVKPILDKMPLELVVWEY